MSAGQEQVTQLRTKIEGALRKQVCVAQAETKEETMRLRLDIEASCVISSGSLKK